MHHANHFRSVLEKLVVPGLWKVAENARRGLERPVIWRPQLRPSRWHRRRPEQREEAAVTLRVSASALEPRGAHAVFGRFFGSEMSCS